MVHVSKMNKSHQQKAVVCKTIELLLYNSMTPKTGCLVQKQVQNDMNVWSNGYFSHA